MLSEQQTTRHVCMIRPRHFGPNAQTAVSNTFQHPPGSALADVRTRVLHEFDAAVAALAGADVNPMVFDDIEQPPRPDAIFPNNWVSFHADGRVYLYPLEAPLRRAERRLDIVEQLSARHDFRVREIVDLSALENDGLFLEGTGSMVLDRPNRMAYAALSSRTHIDALADFAQRADYEVTAFEATDEHGQPIFHTNVMMSLGTRFAVVCTAAIADAAKRRAIVERLAGTGRTVIDIDFGQLRAFAGNLLELRDASGAAVIALSTRARASFDGEQVAQLADCGRLLAVDVGMIEHIGGGGIRCMLAEVFLPRI